jgi:Uncharacterized protein conserved in bacteria (DUF2147)
LNRLRALISAIALLAASASARAETAGPIGQWLLPSGKTRWVYNPGNGHIYDARLSMQSADQLQVQGCVAFICKAQVWTRAP